MQIKSIDWTATLVIPGGKGDERRHAGAPAHLMRNCRQGFAIGLPSRRDAFSLLFVLDPPCPLLLFVFARRRKPAC